MSVRFPIRRVKSDKARPVDVHVGERIRLGRALVHMSQSELAKACEEITFQQVQKYESGHNRVSASRLVQIAAALGQPITFFFEGLPDYPVRDGYDSESLDIVRLFNRLSSDQQAHLKALMAAMRPNYVQAA